MTIPYHLTAEASQGNHFTICADGTPIHYRAEPKKKGKAGRPRKTPLIIPVGSGRQYPIHYVRPSPCHFVEQGDKDRGAISGN
jgi:hypothetical protein